jgi:hypothetical protein
MSPQREAASRTAGRGLLGLVLILGILGTLGAVALASTGGSTKTVPSPSTPAVGSSSSRGAAIVSEAANVVCKAEYAAVSAAVSEYEAANDRPPGSISELGSILKDPGVTSGYRITINPNKPGQVEVASDGHAAQPGDEGCAFAH